MSADSAYVVYLVPPYALGQAELYSVPIDGGAVIKLNAPLMGSSRGVWRFQIAPDGGSVIYGGDVAETGQAELFRAPIIGGDNVRVNGPLVEDGGVGDFAFTPDGHKVLYRAAQESPDRVALFATFDDAPPPTPTPSPTPTTTPPPPPQVIFMPAVVAAD